MRSSLAAEGFEVFDCPESRFLVITIHVTSNYQAPVAEIATRGLKEVKEKCIWRIHQQIPPQRKRTPV